jgi:hypothetical protein
MTPLTGNEIHLLDLFMQGNLDDEHRLRIEAMIDSCEVWHTEYKLRHYAWLGARSAYHTHMRRVFSSIDVLEQAPVRIIRWLWWSIAAGVVIIILAFLL